MSFPNGGGPVFRINDTNQLAQTKLGRTMQARDDYPGVSDTGDFQNFDPTQPIAYDPQADDVVGILKDIRTLLRTPEKLTPLFAEYIKPLPATANSEISFQTNEDFRNIFLSPTTRDVTVIAGLSSGIVLATVVAGKGLKATLPFPIIAVTLQWTTAPTLAYAHIVLSSEPMSVDIIG